MAKITKLMGIIDPNMNRGTLEFRLAGPGRVQIVIAKDGESLVAECDVDETVRFCVGGIGAAHKADELLEAEAAKKEANDAGLRLLRGGH